MNTVESAEKEILSRLYKPDVHEVSLNHSLNRVLAEDVFADRDFPPFNRVAMDGIAIQFESFNGGQRSFLVESVQAAGSTKLSLKNPKNCVEVMTGAVLPEGCDCVIRYEDVEIEGELAEVKLDTLRLRQNIHQQGSDLGAHALILEKFCILRSAEIGILATVGISKVKVLQPPKIAIISTGDELIEVDEIPLPHQIRKSNVLSLEAMLNNLKVSSQLFHLSDNKSLIKSALQQIVKEFDTLLLSGAVSKGKFDFLPEILAELDIEQHFHIVEQRPGKPFWFGSKEGLNVFAFPGNPVSTFVCAHRYLVPWLHASMQQPTAAEYAVLDANVTFKPPLTYFAQVSLSNKDGRLMAAPVAINGSGDLAGLHKSDGFLELPATAQVFKKGEVFRLFRT